MPTAALRARLNAAVAQLETSSESEPRHSQARRSGGFLASLAGLFNFTPRAAAAFATLLLAVAAGIIYISSQKSQQTNNSPEIARTTNPTPAPAVTTTPENVEPKPAAPIEKASGGGPTVVPAKHGTRRSNVRRQPAAPRAPKEEALPGEKAYQTAIASLEKTIKSGGDESFRPAVRADYERNLALIDSAIAQTRQVAARNPKDKDAVGFLMSVYQSKVELLARVADQAQVATLGR